MKESLPGKPEMNIRPRQNMAYRAGNSLKLLMKINIPTKITFLRIALVVILFGGLLVLDYIPGLEIPAYGPINLVYLIALIIFIIASLTDFLDGYLARKWHQVTDLGKFLDPIADKLLVNCSLLYLMLPHFNLDTLTIPLFCVILMISRDLIVDAFRFIASSKGLVLSANIFGKMKTVLQMIAIPLVFLNGWPFSYFDSSWNPLCRIATIFIYLATFMSVLSGVIYIVSNRFVLKEKKEND